MKLPPQWNSLTSSWHKTFPWIKYFLVIPLRFQIFIVYTLCSFLHSIRRCSHFHNWKLWCWWFSYIRFYWTFILFFCSSSREGVSRFITERPAPANAADTFMTHFQHFLRLQRAPVGSAGSTWKPPSGVTKVHLWLFVFIKTGHKAGRKEEKESHL